MTVKTLRGLELNPTFEKLVATGESWDFPSDAEYFGRAAINFRNSWFGSQLDPVGSVVDEDHDEQVQKVLAAMKAFADQQDKRRERKREGASRGRNALRQAACTRDGLVRLESGVGGERRFGSLAITRWTQRQ